MTLLSPNRTPSRLLGDPSTSPPPGAGVTAARARLAALARASAWAAGVYVGSRLLVLALAGAVALVSHRSLVGELTQFDGQWYLRLALHGYPTRVLHVQSTLGFMPAYPLVTRVVSWVTSMGLSASALAISAVGGLVTAVLVERLAGSWWGPAAGRRAVVVLCLFPGSIVFSMAYAEGLLLPLSVGCVLALGSRRYVLAGLLAGLATAVEPMALVLVPVCALASLAELRRRGWRDRAARRSLLAPVLSVAGIGTFGVFLWAWTGTPFAAYLAQHYGWYEQTEPLAALALPVARHLLARPSLLIPRLFSWNLWNGLAGAGFLVASLVALRRVRKELSVGGLAVPVGVAVVTFLSVMTPPNARMLLVAFPTVLVWARRRSGWPLVRFVALEVVLLVGASVLTLSGHMLP